MKKFLFTTFIILMVSLVGFAQSTVNVTFQVNMGAAIYNGTFNIATDSLCVRGSFQADAGDPGGDWQGYYFKMTKNTNDSIYTVTATIPDTAGKQYEYKFVIDDGGWESVSNRTFTLGTSDTTLPVVWYNDNSTYNTGGADVNVTFRVNMGAMIANGLFVMGQDSLAVRGDFQAAAGDPGGDWQGYYFKLALSSVDSIYTVTVAMPSSGIGNTYAYKFAMSSLGNDVWESTGNRTLVLGKSDTTLPVVWFNDDSTYTSSVTTITDTVTFICDLSKYIGTAPGQFDPSRDSIQILGLSNWGGWTVTDLQGSRTLSPDPFQVGIYYTTLIFSGPDGDSTAWKFKAFPDSVFGNGGGYELGDNRWYYFSAAKTVDTVGPYVPNIVILQPGIKNAVDVTFMVDMRNAVDVRNNMAIIPDSIHFVGLKGGLPVIGNWGGDWTVADTADSTSTTAKTMWALNDQGKDGDQVAGDNIWSITMVFPAGTPSGLVEYKYGCDYPGVDTVNGGAGTPLDNEMGFGINHSLIIADGPAIIIRNVFGQQDSVGQFVTSIKKSDNMLPNKYNLSQNYPNPFNPSTVINYSIPKAQIVTLKVYNVLGQEVMTLINQEQAAGNYHVTFDASRLSSGIYFYTIRSGNFSMTKKMMLLK